MSFELSFPVPKGVDEADAIKLTRNYLHRTFRFVADQTDGWFLDDEQVAALKADEAVKSAR